jgi:PAS domain-containing protein
MSTPTATTPTALELRRKAVMRLAAGSASIEATGSMSTALAVLHELASSPATAADALALLHELQVHQVELDLQADEMRQSRAELEDALAHQLARIDAAPVGLFTVDRSAQVHEVNAPGAGLLNLDADALVGQHLNQFLSSRDADALLTLLALADSGSAEGGCALQLQPRRGAAVTVHATAVRLDDHGQLQLALMRAGS